MGNRFNFYSLFFAHLKTRQAFSPPMSQLRVGNENARTPANKKGKKKNLMNEFGRRGWVVGILERESFAIESLYGRPLKPLRMTTKLSFICFFFHVFHFFFRSLFVQNSSDLTSKFSTR